MAASLTRPSGAVAAIVLLCAALPANLTAAGETGAAAPPLPGHQSPPAIPREVIRRADGSEFRFPQLRDARPPLYPRPMFDMAAEGWVVMSFVVQRDGTVRDPIVIDSSRKEFERAALNAVRKFIYAPAEVDGQPLDGVVSKFRITFALEPRSDSARPDFVRRFRQVERQITRGELDKAGASLEILDSLSRLNLYEDAFYWWAHAMYQDARGEPAKRRDSLLRAIAYVGPEGSSRLPAQVHTRALEYLYADYIRTGELAAALDTHAQLVARVGEDAVSPELRAHASAVREILQSDATIQAEGMISDERPWHHSLSRDGFEFADLSGRLQRLALWCENRAVEMEIDPDSSWQVPASWGACEIYVNGLPGTRFTLVEYSSAALP